MSSGSTEETPIYIPEDAQAMHCTARHGPLSLPPPAHCSSPTSNKWASYISVHTMHGPLKRPNIAMALYHIPIQNLYLPNYPSPTQKAQTTLCGLPARNVGLSKRDDESAGDRKFLNLRSLRSVRPPNPSPSSVSVSLSLSFSLSTVFLSSLSPTSGSRLGGAARPPAASLSPLHIAVPHAYSSLLARGWKGGCGGPSSAAPNRALASELAVEEGDEILHGCVPFLPQAARPLPSFEPAPSPP